MSQLYQHCAPAEGIDCCLGFGRVPQGRATLERGISCGRSYHALLQNPLTTLMIERTYVSIRRRDDERTNSVLADQGKVEVQSYRLTSCTGKILRCSVTSNLRS